MRSPQARALSSAEELLDSYSPSRSAFFSSARGALMGSGVVNVLDGPVDAMPAAVATHLRSRAHDQDAGEPVPVAIGAVPFNPGGASHVVVPECVVRTAGPASPTYLRDAVTDPTAPAAVSPPSSLPWRTSETPSAAEYAGAVGAAVRRLRGAGSDGLAKVVLARCLDVQAPGGIDVEAVLRRLFDHDPSGHTFAVGLPSRAGVTRTLVGASPELLISRRGSAVFANPLAGSLPRGGDADEDRRRGEQLLSSGKDRREHAFVVESVADILAPFCSELVVSDEPALVTTAAMWHLASSVHGTLRDPSVSALTLASALHPTPAVCGTPQDQARAAIAALEGFPRDYYAGMVGWCDAHGDGEWVVAIRCADIEGSRARLYSGAGIVADSVPALEVAETAAKFATVLRALGLELDVVTGAQDVPSPTAVASG